MTPHIETQANPMDVPTLVHRRESVRARSEDELSDDRRDPTGVD